MWRRAEKSAPFLGEFCKGANLHMRTKTDGHEEALVQKERMELRRSRWKYEEGKTMNMSITENYNRKRPGRET